MLVHYAIPESPRWYLRRGQAQSAVDAVNLMIRRCGNRVAPLTVGDGAFIAAGSVITMNVAPDAMAFGRAREVQKPGLAAAFRARRNREKK